MGRLFLQIVYYLTAFFFRVGLKGAVGRASDLLMPNSIDQGRRLAIGIDHIAQHHGNFFEANGPIQFFGLKRWEKIGSRIVAKAVLTSKPMRVEMKTAHFSINLIAVFNQLDLLGFDFFKDFFFDTFSR